MKVYLDNSATSWPKPQSVINAITGYLTGYGASPGRSGHSFAVKVAREVFETRELIASFFNIPESERVIFTANATLALNIAIKGLLKKGDHVIISHLEHNSVHRPLRYLERNEIIELTVVDCNKDGNIDLEKFKNSFKPNTKLVVTIHGSNVSGTILPITEIGKICKEKNVLFMIDASQTAGFVPIDMQKQNIDILVFTGHKKLYGPPGIGGLCIKDNIMIDSFIHGGSGSKSEFDTHPDSYPDRLEAGTLNSVGILGLKAGIEYVMEKGIENIQKHQLQLLEFFIKKLQEIDNVILYGPKTFENRLPLISLNVKNIVPSDLAYKLDSEFGIMVRSGLHCSPLTHKAIGSFPQGTVRFSFGCFTTEEEIIYSINSLKKIIENEKS